MTLIEAVVVISGAIGALLTTLCWSVRRSRCTEIHTPCLSCSRDLMTDKEMRADKLNTEMTNRMDSYATQGPLTPQAQQTQLTRMKSKLNIDTTTI